MKTTFPEFQPINIKPKDWFDDAIIVLDTNVLLDLYRISSDGLNDLKKILSNGQLQAQLWMPYQVGLEFYVRADSMREAPLNDVNRLSKRISDDLEKLCGYISTSLKPQVAGGQSAVQAIIDPESLSEVLQEAKAKAIETLNEAAKQLKPTGKDGVRAFVEKVYQDKVGSAFTDEEVLDHAQKAPTRLEGHIPPGASDSTKNVQFAGANYGSAGIYNPGNRFGDYFIWMQVIKHAHTEGRRVIFVSGDKGWSKTPVDSKSSLNLALTAEFRRETGQAIKHYDAKSFFQHASEHYAKSSLAKSTMDELGEISKQRGKFRIDPPFTMDPSLIDNWLKHFTATVPVKSPLIDKASMQSALAAIAAQQQNTQAILEASGLSFADLSSISEAIRRDIKLISDRKDDEE